MGSLVSRRKRAVKVSAKSISVQATECSLQESLATDKEASLQKRKGAIMELHSGDGLSPSPENTHQQTIQKEGPSSTNEHRRRKIGLPSKAKIRPRSVKKNQSQETKDFATQYNFFTVDEQDGGGSKTTEEAQKSQFLDTGACGGDKEDNESSGGDTSQPGNSKTLERKRTKTLQLPFCTSLASKAVVPGQRDNDDTLNPTIHTTQNCKNQEQSLLRKQPNEIPVHKTVDEKQSEEIDEDTLDWNVDDRVPSPSDPENKEDDGSCGFQEVIAEDGGVRTRDYQEDVMVTGYCSDGAGPQEEDLAEDVLDINVDDRIHSPSDSRCDGQPSSDEDDTIDLLMTCSMVPEVTSKGQRQNSLTTLKDGDSAEGSMYSPPPKSPPRKSTKLAEEAKNAPVCTRTAAACVKQSPQQNKRFTVEVIKEASKQADADVSSEEKEKQIGHVHTLAASDEDHPDGNRNLPLGISNTENTRDNNSVFENASLNLPVAENEMNRLVSDNRQMDRISSPDLQKQENEENLQCHEAENDETFPSIWAQSTEDQEPPKEKTGNEDSPEKDKESHKHDNKTEKLLMNVGDFNADDEMSKTIMEIEEATAMTLLLLRGALPCETSEEVERGAGDGGAVEVSGANLMEENQDTDERAGIAAMLSDRSKSSCQIEQLQSEHSQLDSAHSDNQSTDERDGLSDTLDEGSKSSSSQLEELLTDHSQIPEGPNMEHCSLQPPQNNNETVTQHAQSGENDSSAACACAEDAQQPNQNITADASRGLNLRAVRGAIVPQNPTSHSAAAASFLEERTEESLLSPMIPASPGAAASSGDWEAAVPQRSEVPQNIHGGQAACASSARSRTRETDVETHHPAARHQQEASSSVIEVHVADVTGSMTPSRRDGTSAQPDEVSHTLLREQQQQNRSFRRNAEIVNTQDAGKPEMSEERSEEMEPNVQDSTENEAMESSRGIPVQLKMNDLNAEPEPVNNQAAEVNTDKSQKDAI